MTILTAFTRWAHLLALMTVFGAATFSWPLQRRSLAEPVPSHLPSILTAIAAGSAFVQFLLTAANMSGSASGALDPVMLSAVLQHTMFGGVFLFRAALLAALLALTARRKPALPFVSILSGAALAAVALTSHAAASGRAAYTLLRAGNDALHLLSGGFWIGGLAVLLRLALNRAPSLHAIVSLFSRIALYVVMLLALAGTINTAFIFAAQRVSWFYVALLALKVGGALAMIALAFVNRLRVMPALAEGHAAGIFARNVRAELLLGAGVVALAAVLGSIQPG